LADKAHFDEIEHEIEEKHKNALPNSR